LSRRNFRAVKEISGQINRGFHKAILIAIRANCQRQTKSGIRRDGINFLRRFIIE
jgi:hypothetical protein